MLLVRFVILWALFIVLTVSCLANAGVLYSGSAAVGGAPVINALTLTTATPASNGGSVGTATCSSNCSSLTWSITGGNAAGDFAINSSTGAITFTAQGATDYNGSSDLVSATLTVQASNGGGSGNNSVKVNAYADGSVNAPAGTGNFSTLLNSMTLRAPWKVAGVDYFVGPNITITQDWSTYSQTGVTVDTTNCLVTAGSAGITVNNIDATTNHGSCPNGAELRINANGVTLQNFKTTLGISVTASGTNATIQYGTTDSAGLNTSGGTFGDNIFIDVGATGTTLKYVYAGRAFKDGIACNTTANGVTILFSLFYSTSMDGTNGHAQNINSTCSNTIAKFSLWYQPAAVAGLPSCIQASTNNTSFVGASPDITGTVWSYNTGVALGTTHNVCTNGQAINSGWVDWTNNPPLSTNTGKQQSPVGQHNYVTYSGNFNPSSFCFAKTFDTSVVTPTVSDNWNMETGIQENSNCN